MPSDAWDPPESAPRRLSPLSMLLAVRPQTLLVIVIATVGSGGLAIALLVPILAVVVAIQAVTWYAFRWGFDGRVVRVEQGVLQRSVRALDATRLQQVEIEQSIIHRMFGLATLRMETASEGSETEVELDGVDLAMAQSLEAAVRAVAAGPLASQAAATGVPHDPVDPDLVVPLPPPAAEETVTEVSLGMLALSALTGAQLLALPVVLFAIYDTLLDVGAGDVAAETAAGLGGAALAVLLALGAFVAAVVTTVVRDGGYRVSRRGDDIVVRRGLLTNRVTVFPRRRVQVVVIRQNWLRRALGTVSVHVRTAGGGSANVEARRVAVPLMRPGPELDRLLDLLLPVHPDLTALVPHPPAAQRRAQVRWTLRLAVPAAVLAGLAALAGLGPLATRTLAFGAVVVLAAGPVMGLVEYGNLAHLLAPDVLVTRQGAFGITTSIAPLRRLQGVSETSNPFQRRLDLASVTAHLAGSGTTTGLAVMDVASHRADVLRGALTAEAARP